MTEPPPSFDEFSAALRAWSDSGEISLALEPVELWCTLAALQLALRHPEFPPNIHGVTTRVAHKLQAQLPEGALAELAEAGWHREHDA